MSDDKTTPGWKKERALALFLVWGNVALGIMALRQNIVWLDLLAALWFTAALLYALQFRHSF